MIRYQTEVPPIETKVDARGATGFPGLELVAIETLLPAVSTPRLQHDRARSLVLVSPSS